MKIGVLFPGYGSQFVGMAKELYDESRIVQEYFEQAANCLDINFVKLCFASSDLELGRMQHAYTATFLVSCAIYAILKEKDFKPTVFAGYNLGQYAAMWAGDCFTFPDGLYLLNKYAQAYEQLLQEIDVAAVRVTGIPAEALRKVCKKIKNIEIAFYLADTIHIVTGETSSINQLRDHFIDDEIVTVEDEEKEIGLHSSRMDPVIDVFKMYLEKVDFKDLVVPMLSNINAKKIQAGTEVRNELIESIHMPVQLATMMKELAIYDMLIEIGPNNTLQKLITQEYPDLKVISVNTQKDIQTVMEILGNG